MKRGERLRDLPRVGVGGSPPEVCENLLLLGFLYILQLVLCYSQRNDPLE